MSWIRNLKLGSIFLSILIGFIALELFSYLLVRNNLLLVNEQPRLYQGISSVGGRVSRDWWTEQDLWGAWHKKHAVANHIKTCFSVEYRSNSIGARDDEFVNIEKEKTYVMLGDSFAEGIGVNFEDTAHRIIEKNTNTKLLNFGSGGAVGPLQYWLIYENLAKSYPHEGLIIFFLPSNDFLDNDYKVWTKNGQTYITENKERYRPYYRKINADTYEYFIPSKAVKREEWGYESAHASMLKQWLVDNFWLSNTLRTGKYLLLSENLKNEIAKTNTSKVIGSYSGYFDATEQQQQAAIHFINKILHASSPRKVLLVSIPTPEDFERVSLGNKREGMTWWKAFKNLEAKNKSIHFLDLLDKTPHDIDSLFIPCDGHWSLEGNKWAADNISKVMRDKFKI